MRYRSEIDGLRAVAVVPVILYHAGFSAFSGGYVGVDVFFVISGYLITTIIADEITEGRFSILHFYERRARRILPGLLAVLLTSLPFAWFWMMPRDLETFTYSVLAVVTFTSNFLFWSETDYFATTAELQPMLHTWSLAVEEQYYIIFPPLMLLIWRRKPFAILAALLVVSFFLAEWALGIDPAAAFFLLPMRAWELLGGALAALYLRRAGPHLLHPWVNDGLGAFGLTLIMFGVFVYDDSTRFPGLYAVPPTLGTLLVILFVQGRGLVCQLLGQQLFVWIGLISYGAYLWHQPVFSLFQHRFGSVAFESYALVLIALSFALAYASYRLIELPFRRRCGVRRLVWSMTASTIVGVGVAFLIFSKVDTSPEDTPSYRWALANADATLLDYLDARDVFMECGRGTDDYGIRECEFGDPTSPRTLVLWGDSLALALLSGIDGVAHESGVRGIAFISNGCPPVPGLENTLVSRCNGETHTEVMERISALSGVRDVVITGNLEGAIRARNVRIGGEAPSLGAVRERLSGAISRFEALGMRVIMLEQGPTFREPVSSHLLQNLRHGHSEPLVVEREAYIASLSEVRTLNDLPNLYLEAAPIFCRDEVCPSVDEDGELVVFDRNHVTRAYSAKLARYLFERADL